MEAKNVPCDIYVGTNAGAQLKREIEGAKYSVEILSPYLSPRVVEKVLWTRQRGVLLKIVTSEEMFKYKKTNQENLSKMIAQKRKVDLKAYKRGKECQTRIKILKVLQGVTLLATAYTGYTFSPEKLLYPLGVFLLLELIRRGLQESFKKIKFYEYSYQTLFPFRILEGNESFVHAKIYIIDKRVAYIGSLNYTWKGISSNYEVRTRITDKGVIKELSEIINGLFDEEKWHYLSPAIIGSFAHGEPQGSLEEVSSQVEEILRRREEAFQESSG